MLKLILIYEKSETPLKEFWLESPSAGLPTDKTWFSKFSGKHGKPPRW